MPKRIAKISKSLKQIGDIQVNDWDFAALLHKDIGELEIRQSLRRLGNLRVMEWDFKDVLPAVNKLAHQEVDIVGFFRRTAHYKVMEWDFRSVLPGHTEHQEPGLPDKPPGGEDMQALTQRLKDFLHYVVVNLIDEPRHARIKVREIAPGVLRFKIVLLKRDLAMLVGTGGHTATALRNVLKTAAQLHGVQALLLIHSHEEDASLDD